MKNNKDLKWVKAKYHQFLSKNFVKRIHTIKSKKSIITFTFDDFPQSAVREGASILNRFKVNGTYYASFGLMESTNENGCMFNDSDIKYLLDSNHEIGCHTFLHDNAYVVDRRTFKQSLERNQEYFKKLFPQKSLECFSFPFGYVTINTKRITAKYYNCCRGIENGINKIKMDLNLLKANAIYSRNISTEFKNKIKNLISITVDNGGWLIFYTHDISSNPSPYGCTPACLEYVVKCSLEMGAEVLTIGQSLNRLGIK